MEMSTASAKSKLRDAREKRGLTQEQLADLAGTSQPQIDRLESGKRKLTIDWMVRLAPHLGVTPIDLAEDQKALDMLVGNPPFVKIPGSERSRYAVDGQHRVVTTRSRGLSEVGAEFSHQIPIRSAARGGSGQEMFLEDGPIGHTVRPNNLRGVKGAYAIYMTGDSMEPRYYSGWLLHVNPFKPAVRGRSVVVYKKNNEVLVKEFVRADLFNITLRQLNPNQEVSISNAEVAEMHLIVGSDEEG